MDRVQCKKTNVQDQGDDQEVRVLKSVWFRMLLLCLPQKNINWRKFANHLTVNPLHGMVTGSHPCVQGTYWLFSCSDILLSTLFQTLLIHS